MRPLIDQGHLYLACPPLFRLTQGSHRVYCKDQIERDKWLSDGLGGKGKIEVTLQRLGRNGCQGSQANYNGSKSRKLIRVSIDEEQPGETVDLVDRLMGKNLRIKIPIYSKQCSFCQRTGCLVFPLQSSEFSSKTKRSSGTTTNFSATLP